MNLYCLSGNNDTILDFTKKDLIYLNELIENNQPNQTILQEKNIIAPQQIQPNPTFCPDQTKTTFWPNVTNTQDMSQEKNVAMARDKEGGKKGTFWYQHNGALKEVPIHNGLLALNDDIKTVLNRAKIQKMNQNPFGRGVKDILTIGNI